MVADRSMAAAVGRTLPHSLEAEECLISCCLLDGPAMMGRCVEARIKPESFYDAKHGILFDKLLGLYNRDAPIDVSVVAEELKESRELDEIGGYPYLAQVSSRMPTTAQGAYFIDKVREQATLRMLIRTATRAVENCYGYTGGLDEFLDGVERDMFAVTQNRVADKTEPSAPLVKRAMEVINTMITRKGEITGLRSGFADLDQMTWGFQRSDVIVIAARPSMGKTALALNIAEEFVLPKRGTGVPVLFFSLEMSGQQLMQRMICSRARVNMRLLRNGIMSRNGDETSRMVSAADQIAKAPLFIDDSSSIPISHIRARARRAHAKAPLGAIVVDYLQLMMPTRPDVPREQQVSEASRGLKALAKELNVPVIVLSQLNRASERDNRPPKLSDLRESGSIEQDADVVLLLARPQGADEKFQVAGDEAELIVAKQRNGPVGSLKLTFLRDITRFENFTR